MKNNTKKFILNNKLFQISVLATLMFDCMNAAINSEENYLYKELEINHNNVYERKDESSLPSNPFELVEMIRRANSMNDATKPSDALDEAIKSFDMINNKESL